MKNRSLGVFAKFPCPGQVKSRLAAETSPEAAAQTADAFIRDTLGRLAHLEARRVVAFTPGGERGYFEEVADGHFDLVPQEEGDLGTRLAGFITRELDRGMHSVVVVGTDSPTMPPEYVEKAFQMLETADVVIGPAVDGGYYLLGCAERLPPIFDGIAWGSDRVLSQTLERISSSGCRLLVLPPWYDVDTLADLRFLHAHVAAMRLARGH